MDKSTKIDKKNDFQFIEIERIEPEKRSLEQRKTQFQEIYKKYKMTQAATQAGRCLSCGIPYCGWKCPVHNHIPDWLQLVSEGKIIEAAELCHQTNSLPEVCGRVCPQDRLCEQACTLNTGFGAVTIGAVEKYITDTAFSLGWRPDISQIPVSDKKVAIVGAGPAGLSCADVLARNGVKATVFDRHPEIGGLLTFGIPEFKMEKGIMALRRQIFTDMGITFQLNKEVGKDIYIKDLLVQYDAVFLGMGAYRPVEGNIKGQGLQGVHKPLPYLISNTNWLHQYDNNSDHFINLHNKRVIVLGGGDTAMDCNRTAIRQQAKSVHCIYRKSEADMPGSKKEVYNARSEGVHFMFNQQIIEILGKGKVEGIKIKTMNQSTNEVKETILEADAILLAFGFRPSPANWFKEYDVKTSDNGKVRVVNESSQKKGHYPFQTHNEKIFAGGDMVRGADLVVTAIWEGRQSAASILDYLDV